MIGQAIPSCYTTIWINPASLILILAPVWLHTLIDLPAENRTYKTNVFKNKFTVSILGKRITGAGE